MHGATLKTVLIWFADSNVGN